MAGQRLPCAARFVGREPRVLRRPLGCRVLIPIGFDHLSRDAALAQLGFDHSTATGRVAIALLAPPPCELRIIEVAEVAEPLGRCGDDRVIGTGSTEPALHLPPRPRTRAE